MTIINRYLAATAPIPSKWQWQKLPSLENREREFEDFERSSEGQGWLDPAAAKIRLYLSLILKSLIKNHYIAEKV
ncbi:hypothetical protein H9Q13_08920 [Pontibacter sp. JH31]|uniref:Uncharacterized protein n=1 Tax=Pontibacter aquaedesilientis TaxID=2766980 RepID=A0ABR7XG93_9BACT|nr:hypothetical protein [Pontibacter aquaedesilientis]MBD1397284.1 hypothetical protein [Pontibacter aquaedesilientis]